MAFAPLVLAMLGVRRARLTLDGDEIRLRYLLGLLLLRVRLPCALEVGALTAARSRPLVLSIPARRSAPAPTRLADALTLGTSGGTGLRAHWRYDAWRPGPRRRRCDLMLDRAAMVAIEYHLAARSLLTPRIG